MQRSFTTRIDMVVKIQIVFEMCEKMFEHFKKFIKIVSKSFKIFLNLQLITWGGPGLAGYSNPISNQYSCRPSCTILHPTTNK